MKHEYFTRGVCPMKVNFELDEDRVKNIVFTGGCNGNLKAIATLVDGWTVDEITEKLAGNRCGFKKTSCADQLTIAINRALQEERGK